MACFTYGSLVDQCVVPPPCFRHLFRHVVNGDLDPSKDLSRLVGPIVSETPQGGDATLSNYMGCWWGGNEYSRYSLDDIMKMWEDQRKYLFRPTPVVPSTSIALAQLSAEALHDARCLQLQAHDILEADMEATRRAIREVKEAIWKCEGLRMALDQGSRASS